MFGAITLSQTGSYSLVVKETSENTESITADSRTHSVTFNVTRDPKTNSLKISNFEIDGNTVEPTQNKNSYAAEIAAAKGSQAGFVNESVTGSLKLTKELKDNTADGKDSFNLCK